MTKDKENPKLKTPLGQSAVEGFVMWRGSDGMIEPVKVECPNGLYPNLDAEGIEIYENTHFHTEEAAWQNIEDCVLAGVSLSGSAVENAQSQLRQAEKQAAESALEFKQFRKAKTLRKIQDR